MAERLSSWWLHVCSVVLSLPWEPTTFILGVILYKPYFLGLKSPPFCMVLGSKGFFGGNDLIWWVGVVHLGGWLETTGLESLLFEVSSFLEDSWYLGGDSQLTSIFQMGWNHQLGMNTSQHNFFAVCFFSLLCWWFQQKRGTSNMSWKKRKSCNNHEKSLICFKEGVRYIYIYTVCIYIYIHSFRCRSFIPYYHPSN